MTKVHKLFSSPHVQWRKFQEFEKKVVYFWHEVMIPNIIFDNCAAL